MGLGAAMADHTMSRLWMMRAVFVALATGLILFKLLPLDFTPHRWAGPDLVVGFCFAWVLRRPEYVPALSIAAVILLADFMLQRPPGLLAALVVLATQNLRNRAGDLRTQSFGLEWLTVSILMVLVALLYRVTLALTVSDLAPLGLTVIQLFATIAAYPLVMLVTKFVFGVRKSNLGDVNALGQRV